MINNRQEILDIRKRERIKNAEIMKIRNMEFYSTLDENDKKCFTFKEFNRINSLRINRFIEIMDCISERYGMKNKIDKFLNVVQILDLDDEKILKRLLKIEYFKGVDKPL